MMDLYKKIVDEAAANNKIDNVVPKILKYLADGSKLVTIASDL